MKTAYTLAGILLFGTIASAQELTPYSLEEIDQLLGVFKKSYKNKKAPEDDPVAVLEDLQKAHQYVSMREKKNEATKEELKAKTKIVKMIALGLKARKRELVTLKCARVLGVLGDKDGAKPLLTDLPNSTDVDVSKR